MAIHTYEKGSAAKLSENFKAYEFDCNGSGCCAETKIDDKLVRHLQNIRNHFGAKVLLSSGYRCEKHNKQVKNAAAKSRHVSGMAADIKVQGVAPAEVAKYAESIGVLGIGLYEGSDGSFVHIDTRTEKAFWYGHAQVKRSTFGGVPAYTLGQFIRHVQTACGAKVDGIAGPETLGKTPTVSAAKNRSHPVVGPVQKRLAALGYHQVGIADGIAGPKFTAAVKALQKDNGRVGEGELTAGNKTWKTLLGLQA